jgi:mono/diheme cytochrome c family protein
VLLAASLAAIGAPRAQTASSADSAARTTLSGVFSAAQASRGKDTYVMFCQSCHTLASHTGPAFMGAWKGKPLVDLFQYIRYAMPKNEPGTLSDGEYAQVMAYILHLNGMPDGSLDLPADSASLGTIRIVPKVP